MAMTEFALGDALAVQIWSKSLAIEAAKKSYFTKFMGKGPDSLIIIRDELTKSAGEKITYALRMKMTEYGIEGDNTIEGTSAEEALTFYNDAVYIDQLRKGTKSKGKMSEQRVPYSIRKEGRDALATWWAEVYDAQIMCYLAGARGVDTSMAMGTGWTGRANNTLQSPDSSHIIYGGTASSSSDMTTSDKMHVDMFERLVSQAETTDPMIQPFNINGERRYVLLMHTFQAYDLRTSLSDKDWLMIHRATDGMDSPIYKNALGEWAGVILHKHRNVIRFSTYGASSNVAAARALFLGAQAGVIAWGRNNGPARLSWNEEKDDRGNALAITAGSIFGIKKTRFNSADFGTIAVDTAAADPNA